MPTSVDLSGFYLVGKVNPVLVSESFLAFHEANDKCSPAKDPGEMYPCLTGTRSSQVRVNILTCLPGVKKIFLLFSKNVAMTCLSLDISEQRNAE